MRHSTSLLDIAGVRGHLTADALGLPEIAAIGDPGLLINRFDAKPFKDARYKFGIIPHVSDRQLPAVAEMLKTPSSLFIDLGDPDLLGTIRKIRSCDYIASSSLHGLVAADAFGIPAVWVRLSNNLHGGNWKFHDYFSMVGRAPKEPIVLAGSPDMALLEKEMETADKALIEKCRVALVERFKSI